ncbi:class I SAM-dependent methyltransferase [Chengkuizengella axinellae]|uniref:Class I SAM-dependent methyltransferase n=1 Tax=Chengkuizengella axinellae TaxID=3064388 RepID=A0ABT9IWT9_9BACL|nr:class I SAM-dependent methyltransferase [Chengkuizengella sp. 2205SS18-9]MDP5273718.1 class I SAM-dependent methyltransferase [Chengkuizengella sp. 2205SS18-9]
MMEKTNFSWDQFYTDRNKKIPFFENLPDENLVQYLEKGILNPGKVLELGCGPGRNALFLAGKGCKVDAIDFSKEAIEWGKERASEKNLSINFIHKSIFNINIDPLSYDIVYDSGCLHHLPPHRRISYLNLVNEALKPGGFYALTCFVYGGSLGGALFSDKDVYRNLSVRGGVGFTQEKLMHIFHEFDVIEIRKMKDVDHASLTFGHSDLWTAIFQKRVI